MSHGPGRQEREPSRNSESPSKSQKESNGDPAAAVIPILPANPDASPQDFCLGVGGSQDGSVALPAAPASGDPMPDAGAGPQLAGSAQGPNAAAGVPQITAFMVRMQPASAEDGSTQQEWSPAGLAFGKKPGEGDTQDVPSLAQTVAEASNTLIGFGQSHQQDISAAVREAAPPARTPELQTLRPEEPVRAPQPLNNILLQVNQSAHEKVLVHLVQQSGELRMAVRTDNSELAHGLQGGLSDLVGKLQGDGYRADVWHPIQSGVAAGPSQETQNTSNHSGQGDSPWQQGGSQQDGSQQRQHKPNLPHWVEELEFNLTGKGNISGESYGVTS